MSVRNAKERKSKKLSNACPADFITEEFLSISSFLSSFWEDPAPSSEKISNRLVSLKVDMPVFSANQS